MQLHLLHTHIWKHLEMTAENAEPLNMHKPIAASCYVMD